MGAPSRPLIDVFLVNDEVDMLRYRLQLHAPITRQVVIVEANLTFTGIPKPLHVRDTLSQAELERHNVLLLQAQLSPNSDPWVLEGAQRRFVNKVIAAQIAALPAGDDALVYVSDVDELLDPSMMPSVQDVDGCVSPLLRNFYYSEYCANARTRWAPGVLFRARGGWFENQMLRARGRWNREMRRKMMAGCHMTHGWVGWHFGYFLNSSRILRKLKSFSHNAERYVQDILKSKDPLARVDEMVGNCTDVRGATGRHIWQPYDGRLPEEATGLVRHARARTLTGYCGLFTTTQLCELRRGQVIEYEQARKELSHLRQHTPSDVSKSLSHWEAGAELSASSFGIASLSWSPMPLGKEDVKQSNVTKKMRLWVAAVRLNVTNAELLRRSYTC